MPSTFSQIYIQIVLVVKGRQCMIHQSWEEDLYKYITGIVKKKGLHLLAINGMPDHIHFLIRMRPASSLSDLMREIKKSTNDFINESGYIKHRFYWQEGYGAFSYSQYEVEKIINYIKNQKEHHLKQSFKVEYLRLLDDFQIEYKDEYLFEWIE